MNSFVQIPIAVKFADQNKNFEEFEVSSEVLDVLTVQYKLLNMYTLFHNSGGTCCFLVILSLIGILHQV